MGPRGFQNREVKRMADELHSRLSGALQTTLNKDEVCWKTASQVGKSSEHTGVDHWPAPYPLTVQSSDPATASLAAEPENHSSQFK